MRSNKQKWCILLAAGCLTAAAALGGTLAWFTSSAAETNTVQMGTVGICLFESDESKPSGRTELGLTFKDVMPGDVLAKDPTVALKKDSQPVYVRAAFVLRAQPGSGLTEEDLALLQQSVRGEILAQTAPDGSALWVADDTADGTVYYCTALLENGATKAVRLFSEVVIPGKGWGNNTADSGFTLCVQAQAVQAANITPDFSGGDFSWFACEPLSL